MTGPMSALPARAGGHAETRFRIFLRALAEEIDAVAGANGRDSLLRNAGHRMARLLPLPAVGSMEALELEMNERLGEIGWGSARLALNEEERCLLIAHAGLPRLGAAGDPPGTWFGAVLEGLYEAWMADQPGGDPALVARRHGAEGPDVLTLRLSRA